MQNYQSSTQYTNYGQQDSFALNANQIPTGNFLSQNMLQQQQPMQNQNTTQNFFGENSGNCGQSVSNSFYPQQQQSMHQQMPLNSSQNVFQSSQNNITSNYNQVTNTNDNQNASQNQGLNQVVYTTYENLPNYPQGVDLNAVVAQVHLNFQDKQSWKKHFDSLDNLRVINKQFPQEVNQIFINFGNYIVEAVGGAKTCTTRNALMLLREVFLQGKTQKPHDDIINKFVPILLQKSVNELQIIQAEAKQGLLDFTNNFCCSDSAYMIICSSCFNKNTTICETSMRILARMIQCCADNFTKLQPQTLQAIMKSMTRLLDSKRQTMQDMAHQICNYIGGLVGQENYINLMQHVLTNEECSLMYKCIYSHNQKQETKESKKRESVAQFKRSCQQQQQQQNMQMQMNPNYIQGNCQNSNFCNNLAYPNTGNQGYNQQTMPMQYSNTNMFQLNQ